MGMADAASNGEFSVGDASGAIVETLIVSPLSCLSAWSNNHAIIML
jgi:hypothetical protein